ncbi:transposase [Singulisphaera sp. GP187]|uniref:IS66 family transposase n=1 Tax=Singulisphaera sp. GP187 TaxID=1882752 RepID=UPI0009FB3710|nr:transposase [Singulisphaera sp. GP187]
MPRTAQAPGGTPEVAGLAVAGLVDRRPPPVTVLGGKKPGSTKGRIWAYIGDAEHPYSVYDFTMSQARDGPATFLTGYHGFLQADAYTGHEGIYIDSQGTILELACWAHARRKFYDARTNAPRNANQVLELIHQLYDVEDRGLSIGERHTLRQQKSTPILDRMERAVNKMSVRNLPKSAMGCSPC